MRTHHLTHHHREQGVVVAGFALVIILVLAVASIASITSAFFSQRIATNNIRIGQAIEAAEAGLNLATASLRTRLPPYPPIIRTLPNGTSFVATVTEFSEHHQRLTHYTVVSQGSSIDGSANRTIRQTVVLLRLLQSVPEMPLIARRSLLIDGSSRIANPEGGTTIWSNSASGFSNASPGATYINARGDGSLLKSTTANRLGADVVLNDATLPFLSDDEFYYLFIGFPRQQLHELSATRSNITWLTDPSGTVRIAHNAIFGSFENPVLVYIDGHLNITGSPVFNGLLYVRGDFTNAGNAVINGAVVVEGASDNTKLTGNLTLTYNRELLSRLNNDVPYVSGLAGTWKDF